MHDWSDRALCIGTDTVIFYPDQGGGVSNDTRDAQRVCKKCPVRIDCLMHALNHPETFGIWGGVSYRSRLKILRKYDSPITYDSAMEAIKNYDNTL